MKSGFNPSPADGARCKLVELNPGDCFESALGYAIVVGCLTGGDMLVEYVGSEGQSQVSGLVDVEKISQEAFNKNEDQYARRVKRGANRLVDAYSHLVRRRKER